MRSKTTNKGYHISSCGNGSSQREVWMEFGWLQDQGKTIVQNPRTRTAARLPRSGTVESKQRDANGDLNPFFAPRRKHRGQKQLLTTSSRASTESEFADSLHFVRFV